MIGYSSKLQPDPQAAERSRRLERAHLGVAMTFFLTGVTFGTFASRIPAIKSDLGLTDSQLAVAFIGLNAGAIAGLQAGGVIVPRIGSRPALRVSLPLLAAALGAIGFAPSLALLTAAVFVSAAANSVVDVAMNAHGVTVEEQMGRPLLSRFHAMNPLGGMTGGGIGALAAAIGLGVAGHFLLVSIVVCLAAVSATALLLPASADREPDNGNRSNPAGAVAGWLHAWSRQTLAFGLLAFCVTLAEGAVYDWSAVHLRDGLGAGGAVAAIGVTAFLAGVTLGRLVGDQVIAKLGPLRALRIGGVVATAGFAIALLANVAPVGILGLGLLGIGISYLFPLLLGTAAKVETTASAAATVARVSTLGYLGSFVGPALIGSLAGPAGLATALTLPAALIAAATFAAGRVVPKTLQGDFERQRASASPGATQR